MSDYTIVNMKEVEDQAPKFGLSPDLEARFARVALEAELIGITRIKLGDEVKELKPWDAVRVNKDLKRSFEAGPEGAEFIVVGAPGGPGDAEIDQGWWND